MNDKPRPPNAAGPNGLRGGIKTFVPKTMTGPWLDALGGTAGYKRGFTTVDYETEAQHQQLGATLRRSPEFGAELPDDLQTDRPSSPFQYVRQFIEKETVWATNTQLMSQALVPQQPKSLQGGMTGTSTAGSLLGTSTVKSSLGPQALEEYRQNWTTESTPGLRDLRFTTESRRQGGAVGSTYCVTSTKPLPGTPKAFELFRLAVVQKYGLFAFTVVRYQLGREDCISLTHFRQALRSTGVAEMKVFEVNQMIAFTTPSTTTMSAEQFVHILKGNILGFDRFEAKKVFTRLVQSRGGGDLLATADILAALHQERFPEIALAIKQYGEAVYTSEDGSDQWTEKGLVDMLHDMYAADAQAYALAMKTIWKGL